MKIITWVVMFLLPVLILGCSSVYSLQPMGTAPVKLDPADWNGKWMKPDGVLTLNVMDSDKGLLQLAWLEEKDGKLEMESMEIMVRESGSWMFGNLKEVDGEHSGQYLWVKINREDNQLLIWLPETSAIEALVEKKQLPGDIQGSDVVLGPLTPSQLDIITSSSHGVLMHWEDPVVLSRFIDSGIVKPAVTESRSVTEGG